MQALLYRCLKVLWYSTRAKQSRTKQKVFPSIKLQKRKKSDEPGKELLSSQKQQHIQASITLPSSTCLILLPTCRLSAPLYYSYTFSSTIPLRMCESYPYSKDFKQALKTCTFQTVSGPQASFNWGFNKTTLKKLKMKRDFFSKKGSCWLPGMK